MAMKNMKPATKKIIIALVVTVVLVGIMLALVLPDVLSSGDPVESTSSLVSDGAEMVIDKQADQVKNVIVENSFGKFTVVFSENGDATIQEIAEAELNTELTSSFKFGYVLKASRTIGEITEADRAKYGLDDDSCAKITTEFNDGTEKFVMRLGNSAGGGTGRYVEANGKVYVASVGDNLFYGMYNFVNATVLQLKNMVGDGSDVIDYMKVTGTEYEVPLELQYIGDSKDYPMLYCSYLLKSPVFSGVSTDKIDTILHAICNIQAVGVSVYDPDAVKLEELGLKDPAMHMEFSVDGVAHTLNVSESLGDGYRYVMVDDNPTVYVTEKSSVAIWAEVSSHQLRDNFVWLPMIKSVSQIDITANGKADTFAVEMVPDDADLKNPTYLYKVTAKDGTEISEENYKAMYNLLIGVTVYAEEEMAKGSSLVKITYHYTNGKTNTVEFFSTSDVEHRCVAEVDGKYSGLVREADVQAILDALPKFAKNEKVG